MAALSASLARNVVSSGRAGELPSRMLASRRTAAASSGVPGMIGRAGTFPPLRSSSSSRTPLVTIGTSADTAPGGDRNEPPKRGPNSGFALVCSAL